MKTFKQFNQSTKCPICNTNKEGETVLIPIADSNKGDIYQAEQIHLECLNLFVYNDIKGRRVIMQEIDFVK